MDENDIEHTLLTLTTKMRTLDYHLRASMSEYESRYAKLEAKEKEAQERLCRLEAASAKVLQEYYNGCNGPLAAAMLALIATGPEGWWETIR
jgi:hypothetical protein